MGRSRRRELAWCVLLVALVSCGKSRDGSRGAQAGYDAGGNSGAPDEPEGGAGGSGAQDGGGDGGSADGGDGGAAGGTCDEVGGAGESVVPRATVVFPPRGAYTDADTLLVRGKAFAPNRVRGVEVAGVPATSKDGFVTWSAPVSLKNGVNEFTVSVTDQAGEVTAQAAAFSVVNRGTALVAVEAMDFDAQSGSLIVADSWLQGLFRLDLATQRVSALRNPAAIGPSSEGRAVAVDAGHHRALTFGHFDELIAIDLAKGAVETVSASPSESPSTSFEQTSGIALDAAHERAFVLGASQLVAVDLKNGARQAQEVQGFEPPISELNDIVYDAVTEPAAPRLLVSARAQGRIVAIALDTWQATTLSEVGIRGAGERLVAPSRMKLDPERGRLLVVDGSADDYGGNARQNRQTLLAIDLLTGDRTVLSSTRVGSGFLPVAPYSLALDSAQGRAFFADRWGGQVGALALDGSERTRLLDANVGSGASLEGLGALLLGPKNSAKELAALLYKAASVVAIDPASGDRRSGPSSGLRFQAPTDLVEERGESCARSVLVLDRFPSSVFRLNLRTGQSSLISGPELGDGPALGTSGINPGPGLALDPARNRVLVVDDDAPALVAVDLESGKRTIVSDATTGRGPALQLPQGVVLDSDSSKPRALVGDNQGLIAVDLESGDRSYVTSPDEGGPRWVSRLTMSPELGSVLALANGGLYSIDLATGSSVLVSGGYEDDHPVGAGPNFEYLTALQVDFEHGIAYVADSVLAAVFAVDLVSGDRVLLAH